MKKKMKKAMINEFQNGMINALGISEKKKEMTEQEKKIAFIEHLKKTIENMKSPSSSFMSEEYDEGFYEGWFDFKETVQEELDTVMIQIKNEIL